MEILRFKTLVRNIRRIGKEKIIERINAFKNNEHMPDDILSSILNSYSKIELTLITIQTNLNKKILFFYKREKIWTSKR